MSIYQALLAMNYSGPAFLKECIVTATIWAKLGVSSLPALKMASEDNVQFKQLYE